MRGFTVTVSKYHGKYVEIFSNNIMSQLKERKATLQM